MTKRNLTTHSKSTQEKNKTPNETFISKVINKGHQNHFCRDGSLKYDYSKIEYKNNHSYITLICPTHGEFGIIPYNHLKGGACPSCATTSLISNREFIDRCSTIHDNYYDYSKTKYKGTRVNVIITCPIHGDFEQRPQTHSEGGGCRKCAGNAPLTNKIFIGKSIKIHGDKYRYNKTRYISNSQKVIITCDTHGDFEQMPDSHMRGKGCPVCGGINQGWSKTDFNNACVKNNNGLAVLYVIRCFSENEVFYKVGITSKSVRERFSGQKTMPYSYDVVHELLAKPSLVWDVESEILRGKYRDRYKPQVYFGGCTECLSNIDGIDQYIRQVF